MNQGRWVTRVGTTILLTLVFYSSGTFASTLGERLVDNVYVPAFSEFDRKTSELAGEISDLCQLRTGDSLNNARQSFRSAVSSYSVVEVFTVGPMLADNRNNRLFFWPDTRRAGERQLRKLLHSDQVASLTAQMLAEKSVAVQGFGALERLLFSKTALKELTTAESPACKLSVVVAENVKNIAAALKKAWQGESPYRNEILSLSERNEFIRTDKELKRSIITQAATTLSILSKRKLPLLVKTEDQSESDWAKKVRKSPFWRSRNTHANIAGNLRGIQLLLTETDLPIPAALQNELRFEFRTGFRHLEHFALLQIYESNGSYSEEVNELIKGALAVVVNSLEASTTDRVAGHLGVTQGFNSQDGD